MAPVPPAQFTLNAEDVILLPEMSVNCVGAAIRVVTLNDEEEVLPVEFTAVTITLYAVLATSEVNVAEVAVEEEGVAAEPFNVYV